MRVTILTLFPEFFESPLKASLIGRAREGGLLSVSFVALREFGLGKYKAVDDKPFGGSPGMVMAAPVLEAALKTALPEGVALEALEADVAATREGSQCQGPSVSAVGIPWVVYMSPQGRTLTAALARAEAARFNGEGARPLIILCGHYEGVDERFLEAFVHDEISIGDYVLTGGETAALVYLETLSRFIGGVVGEAASVDADTFEAAAPSVVPGGLKYPMYTRPQEWRGRAVPPVLTSGNHAEVAKWRLAQSEARTRSRRPDLLAGMIGKKPRR